MDGSGGLPAALRLAAVNLAAAAANVGRVLESVADALEPDDEAPVSSRDDTWERAPAAAQPAAPRTPRKAAATPRAKKTTTTPARAAKSPRVRRPPA